MRHRITSTSSVSLILMAIMSHPAGAATFTVTNLNGDGPGSLLQAITDANDAPGNDVIVFSKTLSGAISGFRYLITDGLTIDGSGASIAIDGLKVSGRPIFNIETPDNTPVTIKALTIRNANDGIVDPFNQKGGGILNNGATLTIINSTLQNNFAIEGGGLHNKRGKATIINSTISANAARGAGCGILSEGPLTIINSTITGNWNSASDTCSGIFMFGGTLTIGNSIVAGNNDPVFDPDGLNILFNGGSLASLGHNLIGENGSSGISGMVVTLAASDIVPPAGVDLGEIIGPLANNGGPTLTHLPVAGSLAIDHGANALIPAGVTTDQRGTGFPRIVHGTVDIGAVEVGVSAPVIRLAGLTRSGQIYYTFDLSTWTNIPGQLAQLQVGDLNDDGMTDLIGRTGADQLFYTTNLSTWTPIPGGLRQIVVGDFNGDGQDEVAGLASNGSIWYTTNLITWTQVPGALAQLRVGDLNGDGKADLVGLASNGSIWYTTNLNNWTRVSGSLSQLRVGDLNGDGKADLAGLASNGSIWYTTNLNNWTQVPGGLAQLQTGDLNGDGKADLVGLASNGSIWYTTNLTTWTQVPGGLAQLRVGEFNGDGRADLAGLASNDSIWYTTNLSTWTQIPGQLAQLAGD